MNNAVYDFPGTAARLIGYRCHECQRIKPAMWGDVCNECRENERRHREMIAAMRSEREA
jgi:rRNA maturation endonuclease Nob1